MTVEDEQGGDAKERGRERRGREGTEDRASPASHAPPARPELVVGLSIIPPGVRHTCSPCPAPRQPIVLTKWYYSLPTNTLAVP
ncbi:hypothetical protein VTO42DRAFT_4868 [Malbranchea cinnamomea]